MVLNWTDTLRRIGSCTKSYRKVGAGRTQDPRHSKRADEWINSSRSSRHNGFQCTRIGLVVKIPLENPDAGLILRLASHIQPNL